MCQSGTRKGGNMTAGIVGRADLDQIPADNP